MDPRKAVLTDLLKISRPLDEVIALARDVPNDYDSKHLVIVSPEDLRRALQLYVEGTLAEAQLLEWSSMVETQPQYVFESSDIECKLRPIIFDLANPGLTGQPVTPDAAKRMIAELDTLATKS